MKNFAEIYGARQLELAQGDFAREDKEAYSRFLNNLQARGVKERRLVKYYEKLKGIKPFLKKPLVALSGSEVDDLLLTIYGCARWTAWTKHDFALAVKKFYRFHDGSDERAGRIRVIAPLPELVDENAVISFEDVQALLRACRNVRDKATVLMLFCTGARLSEFLSMRVGDVQDAGDLLRVTLRGTKNRYARRSFAIDDQQAIALFREYLRAHPHRADANAALWLEPVHGQPLEGTNLTELLRYRARVAGVLKAVNPHEFRKGCVTHDRRRGLTNASLETKFGWRKGSDMLAIYDRTGEQALLEDLRRTKPQSEDEQDAVISEQMGQAIYKRPELWQAFLAALREDKVGTPSYWSKKRTSEKTYTPRAGLEPAAA